MMCVLTVFFILLFGVVLSEIAYNRARDENYLRLRWLVSINDHLYFYAFLHCSFKIFFDSVVSECMYVSVSLWQSEKS